MKHAQIQSVRPSDKALPEQQETSTTHNAKDHTKLVEKVRDARHNPEPKKRALQDRKDSTGQHQK